MTDIFAALMASAAVFGLMELMLLLLKTTSTPGKTALLFLPEFVGAILVAGVFGLLFRTKFTRVLALAGLLIVVAAAALLIAVMPSGGPVMGVVAGLLGLGVAASVSPGLFMAGFSLKSAMLQQVFAMIELMGGVTAFMVAPILVFLAGVFSKNPVAGDKDAVWICLCIAAVGFIGAGGLYLTGKGHLETPNLERWQEDNEPAWSSPRVGERLLGAQTEASDLDLASQAIAVPEGRIFVPEGRGAGAAPVDAAHNPDTASPGDHAA